MAHIQIYVTKNCPLCAYASELADEIAQQHPQVGIEVIDVQGLRETDFPETVFATPTWLWDGELYSLGNPDPAELARHIASSVAIHSPTTLEDDSDGREDATTFDDGIVSGPV
jgi:predicted thioredoxin/glutaredoxin